MNDNIITSTNQEHKTSEDFKEPGVFSICGGHVGSHVPGVAIGGGIRGKVCGRSRQSRRRLKNKLASVDLGNLPGVIFLTLTFATVPEVAEQKKMLHAFCSWISRYMPRMGGFWVYEKGKQNEREHYHFVLYGTNWVDKKIYQAAWQKIGGGFIKVKWIPGQTAARYISKYISKAIGENHEKQINTPPGSPGDGGEERADAFQVDPDGVVDLNTAHICTNQPEWTGRTWGCHSKAKIPFSEMKRILFNDIKEFYKFNYQIKRFLRRWLKSERFRRSKTLHGVQGGKVFHEPIHFIGATGVSKLREVWRVYRKTGKNTCTYSPGSMALLFGKKPRYRWLCGRSGWSCYIPQTETFHSALWRFIESLQTT